MYGGDSVCVYRDVRAASTCTLTKFNESRQENGLGRSILSKQWHSLLIKGTLILLGNKWIPHAIVTCARVFLARSKSFFTAYKLDKLNIMIARATITVSGNLSIPTAGNGDGDGRTLNKYNFLTSCCLFHTICT